MSGPERDLCFRCHHERQFHEPERVAENLLGCIGHCHCGAFVSEPEADRLRRAIREHEAAIERVGTVHVATLTSRRRAERKHAADRQLWHAAETSGAEREQAS